MNNVVKISSETFILQRMTPYCLKYSNEVLGLILPHVSEILFSCIIYLAHSVSLKTESLEWIDL